MNTTLLVVGIGILGLLYLYRTDFQRYSILTVGVFKRVQRTPLESNHECRESWCDNELSPGEKRRWYKEIVVGGARLLRYGGGVSYYCEDHAAFEIRGQLDKARPPRVTRVKMGVAGLVFELLKGIGSRVPVRKREDPLTVASDNIADVYRLMPVAFIVITIAIPMVYLKILRGDAA